MKQCINEDDDDYIYRLPILYKQQEVYESKRESAIITLRRRMR